MKNLLVILTVLISLSCNDEKVSLKIFSGEAFGTTYNIQYFTDSEFHALKGIDSVVYAVNRSVSTYMPQSDISKINQGDSTLVVDKIFTDVFKLSSEIFIASEGYFDPTIGVLRNAYGFGDTNPITEIDERVLDSLRRFVGFQKVRLTSEGTIRKAYPEIYLDFNAVAKGYGIDRLGVFLEKNGISDYIVELGGEIRASGKNLKKDESWTAGIENVASELEDRSFEAVVMLENESMASSGNYRKFRIDTISGKKYVHTINPLTGLAEQADVTSATVIAKTCAEADAYATAFMAMGLERSKKILAKSIGIEAYLTFPDSSGIPQVFMTEGFKRKIKK